MHFVELRLHSGSIVKYKNIEKFGYLDDLRD